MHQDLLTCHIWKSFFQTLHRQIRLRLGLYHSSQRVKSLTLSLLRYHRLEQQLKRPIRKCKTLELVQIVFFLIMIYKPYQSLLMSSFLPDWRKLRHYVHQLQKHSKWIPMRPIGKYHGISMRLALRLDCWRIYRLLDEDDLFFDLKPCLEQSFNSLKFVN